MNRDVTSKCDGLSQLNLWCHSFIRLEFSWYQQKIVYLLQHALQFHPPLSIRGVASLDGSCSDDYVTCRPNVRTKRAEVSLQRPKDYFAIGHRCNMQPGFSQPFPTNWVNQPISFFGSVFSLPPKTTQISTATLTYGDVYVDHINHLCQHQHRRGHKRRQLANAKATVSPRPHGKTPKTHDEYSCHH